MLRGMAIIGVIIHHWIGLLPHEDNMLIQTIQTIGGTLVHLFFVFSGCGLTISYYKNYGHHFWPGWMKRRLIKVIIPYWIIITLIFGIVNLIIGLFPELFDNRYSFADLLSYLTFTRNFYKSAWGLNHPMWFMPVIVGLYIIFPLLIHTLKKYGAFALIIVSILLTYGSITIFVVLDLPSSHQAAPFSFFIAEFSFGMLIGYMACFNAQKLRRLAGLDMLCLGVGLYVFSFFLRRYWVNGTLYNDIFTATGVFFITLYLCKWIIRISPKRTVRLLDHLSKESYMMYLIHGPIILYVLKPVLADVMNVTFNIYAMILCGSLFCVAVFFLARLISRPMNMLTNRLSHITFKRGENY